MGEYRKVLVAQIAGKRAVERLAIGRRKCWRERREVKETVVPIPGRTVYNAGYRKSTGIKRRGRSVRSRMRRRRVRAEKQNGNKAETLNSAGVVPTGNVESS